MANQVSIPQNAAQVAAMNLGLSEYVPIPDTEDPAVVMLANAKRYAGDCRAYAPKVDSAIAAILGCRRILWDAADRRNALSEWFQPVVQQTAASMNPEARGPFFRSREQELNGMIKNEYGEAAQAAADGAERALRDLEAALAAGRRKAEYTTLSIGDPTETEAKVRLLEREIAVRDVQSTFDSLESALSGDDRELATLLVLAAEPWAREKLALTPGLRRQDLARGRPPLEAVVDGALDKDNLMLRRMLTLIQEWRVEQVDPSLILASEVFASLLTPAFRAYVGMSAWDLPRSRMDNAQIPDWSERLDDWITRYMPYGRADWSTANATTIARRGGISGPPGWGPRRKAKVGWERQHLGNLVREIPLPAKGI